MYSCDCLEIVAKRTTTKVIWSWTSREQQDMNITIFWFSLPRNIVQPTEEHCMRNPGKATNFWNFSGR